MIIYKCICGDSLEMTENTQTILDKKTAWKQKHNKRNPGHKYVRLHARNKQKGE